MKKRMLLSRITLKITGYNVAELLSRLQKEGIRLKKVIKLDKKTTLLTVSEKDSEKTFAICKRMWYTYSVASRFGARECVGAVVKRIGAMAGAVACIAVSAYCSRTLAFVRLDGNERVSREEIMSVLESAGARIGANVGRIECDELYKALIGLDGIVEASVELNGNALLVTVIERDEQASGVDSGSAIVAEYDSVITSISCISGTARVRIGQVVKKGELLIEGIAQSADGETIKSVRASGEVYGKTYEDSRAVYSLFTSSYARTGRRKRRTELSLLNFKTKEGKSPYATYESESAESVMFPLPIRVRQTVYYETEFTETRRTLDELMTELESKARSSAGDGAKITTHARQVSTDAYEITVITQTERKISKPQ